MLRTLSVSLALLALVVPAAQATRIGPEQLHFDELGLVHIGPYGAEARPIQGGNHGRSLPFFEGFMAEGSLNCGLWGETQCATPLQTLYKRTFFIEAPQFKVPGFSGYAYSMVIEGHAQENVPAQENSEGRWNITFTTQGAELRLRNKGGATEAIRKELSCRTKVDLTLTTESTSNPEIKGEPILPGVVGEPYRIIGTLVTASMHVHKFVEESGTPEEEWNCNFFPHEHGEGQSWISWDLNQELDTEHDETANTAQLALEHGETG
jgi:hypothetical protein